jgi:hypothetical protein
MPLFSNPVVLTDGTDTHSFSYRAQLNDNKSIVGEWVEPAASLTDASAIIIKHDTKSVVKRRLLQRKIMLPTIDPLIFEPCTINFTITHHSSHALADIQKQVNVVVDAIQEENFVNNLLQGLI